MQRTLIALLISFDALYCAVPRPAMLPIAVVTLLSAFQFARTKLLLYGAIALVATGVLVGSEARPERFLFFSGACLAGWLLGLALDGEPLAIAGASGTLAATYLGAFLEKIATRDWSGGVRAVIAAQHVWGHSRLTDAITSFVLQNDAAGRALGMFTLMAQGSALLLPFSDRGRKISATLLLLFHGGVWLLTPIFFPQAMLLVAAFGFGPRPEVSHPPSRQGLIGAAAAVTVIVLCAWLPPVRAFTHRPDLGPAIPPSAQSLALLGDLRQGSTAGNFRISRIDEPSPGRIRLVLESGMRTVVVEIVPRGKHPGRPPRSVGNYDLFYNGASAPLDEIARALRP